MGQRSTELNIEKYTEEFFLHHVGPVFVEFPIDTLYPYPVVKKEIGMKDGPQSLMQKIIQWYDQNTFFQTNFCGIVLTLVMTLQVH